MSDVAKANRQARERRYLKAKTREAINAAVRALRQELKRDGLCLECDRPAAPYRRCLKHRKAAADAARRLRDSA